MLSPVVASTSSEFILAPQLVQDGGGQQAAGVQKAAAALALLSGSTENLAGSKLAGLLGNAGMASSDVLTGLALNFAKAINQSPQPNETVKAFSARIADIIFSMPPLERVAAESKSGLVTLGISASALAGALKNADSVVAARLVALIETHLESPRDSALKTAISSYQATAGREEGQRGAPAPSGRPQVPSEGPQSLPRNPANSGRGVEVLRLLQGGKTAIESLAGNVRPEPQARATAHVMPQTQGVRTADGQIPAQSQAGVPRGAEQSMPNVARDSAGQALQPSDSKAPNFLVREGALASQASNAKTMQGSGAPTAAGSLAMAADPARLPAKSSPVIDFVREAIARADNQDAVVAAAHKVATAAAEREMRLFSGAAPTEEGEEDLEKRISRALGDAARASQAATAGRAAMEQAQQQPSQPHLGVPYAQVPYPQSPVEEAKKKAARDGREDEDERQDEEAGDGSEEQAMQGEGGGEEKPQRKAAKASDNDDNPFAAEEPLERHASDADRAYHMYQKFGGF